MICDKSYFEQKWNEHKSEFLKLIQIPSVYDEKSISDNCPYGQPVRDALEYMKKLCDEAGMNTRFCDNVALVAEYDTGIADDINVVKDSVDAGSNHDCSGIDIVSNHDCSRIDIVSHLDVVGVEGEWTDDPFSGVCRDGKIFGRGTQDMKSGAYLTFLALKLLKENGFSFKNRLRLVYGSDEERTMDDMRRYVKLEGYPAFAFTPDGGFPITIGEKGALMWELNGECCGAVEYLSGGIQPNVIPPEAEAVVRGYTVTEVEEVINGLGVNGKAEMASYEAGNEGTDNGASNNGASNNGESNNCKSNNGELNNGASGIRTRITIFGKAAHASLPEEGENAVSNLLKVISKLTQDEKYSILAKCFGDSYGEGAGINYDIEPMGKLSINPGIIKISNGQIFAQIDCRYPYGVASDALTKKLGTALGGDVFPGSSGFVLTLPYDDPPTLVKEDEPNVQCLRDAYEKCTGEKCSSRVSGGVSYSKVFGNCVVFGTVSEDSIKLAHQKDEYILETDCVRALEIYYNALLSLATK